MIYPFRVVGPATVDFDTRRGIAVFTEGRSLHLPVRYKVQISCLGKEVVSDAAISWGEVECSSQFRKPALHPSLHGLVMVLQHAPSAGFMTLSQSSSSAMRQMLKS